MDNLNTKFMKEIAKIKDPVIFLGVAKILKVKLYGEEKDENGHFISRDFSELFEDVMHGYDCAGRKRKKELLKILKEANKDGTRTENTEATIQDEKVQ